MKSIRSPASRSAAFRNLPRPDMFVCCNNICRTVLMWYEIQDRFFKISLFVLDTPFCHTGFSADAKRYVKGQINEYIAFLEVACLAADTCTSAWCAARKVLSRITGDPNQS
jgi:benzoyl-CoA reductase/2-hydroxyglutaryl-CoA dehydratase subunit BcrC/BadD/HgdB